MFDRGSSLLPIFHKLLNRRVKIYVFTRDLKEHEIGMEVHEVVDQFLRIERDESKVIMNDEENLIKDGTAIIVPAGIQHNIINTFSS